MKADTNTSTTSAGDQVIPPRRGSLSTDTPLRVLTKPLHQLLIIIVSIFLAETIVTLLLTNLPPLSIQEDALFDSLLVTIILFPILYLFMFRPLRLHIAETRRVEKTLREKEDFLQTIIETAPECIKLLAPDGTLLTMNRAGLSMIEADSLDQVKGKPMLSLVHPEQRQAFKKLTEEVFRSRRGTLQFGIVGMKGRHLWLETSAVPLSNDKGEVVSLLGITRDVTERRNTEKALLESEEKYRSLIESTDDSIYLVDRDYRYLYMNKRHVTRMGLSGAEYVGRAYGDVHGPEETKEFIGELGKVFETGESLQHEHRSNRDGKYFLRTLSPVKGDGGKIVAVTVVSKDITERKETEEKLRTLSLTDDLTGLYNRRGFFTLVEQMLKLSRREKRGIFMLYADLDNLKKINDTFGHQEGDQALTDTANILKTTYRASDIIARLGGDEFVVIPVGTTGDNIDVITARFQKAIENHNEQSSRAYNRLSISFGISYYDPKSPCSIYELIVQAERSMYEQKRQRS